MEFIRDVANALTQQGYPTTYLETPPGPDMYHLFIEGNIIGYYANDSIQLIKNPLDSGIPGSRIAASGHPREIYDHYMQSGRGKQDPDFMKVLQIIQNTYQSYHPATIHLQHTGSYVAKFHIRWKEREVQRQWSDNDKPLASFSSDIKIPPEASDLTIKVTEKTGLAWDPWKTVLDRSVSITPDIYVSIWGTPLHPEGEIKDHE